MTIAISVKLILLVLPELEGDCVPESGSQFLTFDREGAIGDFLFPFGVVPGLGTVDSLVGMFVGGFAESVSEWTGEDDFVYFIVFEAVQSLVYYAVQFLLHRVAHVRGYRRVQGGSLARGDYVSGSRKSVDDRRQFLCFRVRLLSVSQVVLVTASYPVYYLSLLLEAFVCSLHIIKWRSDYSHCPVDLSQIMSCRLIASYDPLC